MCCPAFLHRLRHRHGMPDLIKRQSVRDILALKHLNLNLLHFRNRIPNQGHLNGPLHNGIDPFLKSLNRHLSRHRIITLATRRYVSVESAYQRISVGDLHRAEMVPSGTFRTDILKGLWYRRIANLDDFNAYLFRPDSAIWYLRSFRNRHSANGLCR